MFDDTCFSPIGGQTIKSAPTVYSYRTETDTLQDVMVPGYFNSKSLLFAPGSVIHVIAVDEIAQIFVKAVEGVSVILDNRVILAQTLKTQATNPVKKKNNNRTQKAA